MDIGDRRWFSRHDCSELWCGCETEKYANSVELEQKVCATLWAVCEAEQWRSKMVLGRG